MTLWSKVKIGAQCSVFLLFVAFFLYALCIQYSSVYLVIDPDKPHTHLLNENFLSVALDTSVIAVKFQHFNMTNSRLQKIVAELSPGYLRLGGNMADLLIFSRNNTEKNFDELSISLDGGECDYENIISNTSICSLKDDTFIMSGQEWIDINNFAKAVGLSIIFDLNCLIRNENGSWNYENAEELIAFSNEHDFKIDWQLGNEPNAFLHKFNVFVNASQLAKDFETLRKVLDRYPKYKSSKIIGPDITRPRAEQTSSIKYLKSFLENSKHILNAVSWHQYYFNGRTASIDDFLNPNVFNVFEEQILTVQNIVNETGFQNTEVWLGETGSAYGGGAPNLSDRFVASFLWLDKLGLSAKYGIQMVARQSLYEGHYSLIDSNYDPLPDWWISVAYKKLVGPQVLECTGTGYSNVVSGSVRLYCHCANPSEQTFNNPAYVVYGINLNNVEVDINLYTHHDSYQYPSIENDDHVATYIFTAENNSLTSKHVLLNGDILKVDSKNEIPVFTPKFVSHLDLKMPPYSLGFFVVPGSKIEACTFL